MNVFEIHGGMGNSSILVGEHLNNLRNYIPSEEVVVITDSNVARHYSKDFPPCEVVVIGTGEKIKNLDTVQSIYGRLLELEAGRSSMIVGVGGGIVCDVAGFVASTYLRGVRFSYVPTTLLAQVDAGVGGKNGVNFGGYKNMVGVFSQPEFVICDPNFLRTLPEREISCGLAEVIKHAALGDAGLFSYLENYYEKALLLDTDVIERLVHDSVAVKSSIVNRDEREKGERRKLNFGHTFGHAIEKTAGLPHGEAVSAGMAIASTLSQRRGYLSGKEAKRIDELLKKFNLPTRPQFNKESVFEAMKKDKKKISGSIHFVFLRAIGNAVVERISLDDLQDEMNQLF